MRRTRGRDRRVSIGRGMSSVRWLWKRAKTVTLRGEGLRSGFHEVFCVVFSFR